MSIFNSKKISGVIPGYRLPLLNGEGEGTGEREREGMRGEGKEMEERGKGEGSRHGCWGME